MKHGKKHANIITKLISLNIDTYIFIIIYTQWPKFSFKRTTHLPSPIASYPSHSFQDVLSAVWHDKMVQYFAVNFTVCVIENCMVAAVNFVLNSPTIRAHAW